MLKNMINIIVLPLLIYIGVGYFILHQNIEELLFMSIFFSIGCYLIFIVIRYYFYGKKTIVKIVGYKKGDAGNANIGYIGNGRIYQVLYQVDNLDINQTLSYASISSYDIGTEVSGYRNLKNNKIILVRDLLFLLYFGLFFLYPSVKILI